MLIMTFGCFILLSNPLTVFSVIISEDRLCPFIFVTFYGHLSPLQSRPTTNSAHGKLGPLQTRPTI